MNDKIIEFINNNRLLSLAMQDNDGVYIANAFYAFDILNKALIIASSPNSKHVRLATKAPNIAINIAKDNKVPLLKGLQIKAIFEKANEKQKKIYFAKFAFARLMNAEFYALRIYFAKFTNNILGQKIYFENKNIII